MPIMAKLNEPNITRDMYEQARAEIDWDNGPPAGCLLHMASFDEAGAHYVDIWETETAFKAYLETRFYPVLRRMGVPGVNPTWSELHTVAVAPEIEKYVLAAAPLAACVQHAEHRVSGGL